MIPPHPFCAFLRCQSKTGGNNSEKNFYLFAFLGDSSVRNRSFLPGAGMLEGGSWRRRKGERRGGRQGQACASPAPRGGGGDRRCLLSDLNSPPPSPPPSAPHCCPTILPSCLLFCTYSHLPSTCRPPPPSCPLPRLARHASSLPSMVPLSVLLSFPSLGEEENWKSMRQGKTVYSSENQPPANEKNLISNVTL